jgi:hypothetical protein
MTIKITNYFNEKTQTNTNKNHKLVANTQTDVTTSRVCFYYKSCDALVIKINKVYNIPRKN